MTERRKLPRRRTRFPAVILDADTDRFVGHLANITTEGIMIRSESPLEIHSVYRFKIVLPDEICGQTELRFQAQSLWCNPCHDPAYFRTGLQLIQLSERDVKIIGRLIEDSVFERLIS